MSAIHCPRCKKLLDGRPEHFPFCSERCKNVDLGHWFSDSYAISRPLNPDEVDELLPEGEDIVPEREDMVPEAEGEASD